MRADKARIQKAFLPRAFAKSLGPGEIRGKRDVQYDSPFMLVARWKYLVACIYTVPGYLCTVEPVPIAKSTIFR